MIANNLAESFFYPGVTLVLEESLRISYVSQEFCAQFACQPEDIEGKIIESLFDPRDRKGLIVFHNKLTRYEKGFIDLVITLKISDRNFMVRLRMMKRKNQWFATIENFLVEPEDMFRQFHLGRERWTSIVRNSSEGIAILDVRGRLVEFNRTFMEMMEFRSSQGVLLNEDALFKKNLFDLCQQFQEIKIYFEQAKLSRKAKFNQEIKYGQYFFKLEVTPIYLAVQGFAGCSFVAKDITSRKQLEFTMQQIQEKNHELEVQKAELQSAHQEISTLNERLKQENLRMGAELDVAQKLQQMVLPKPEELDNIDDIEITGFMEPADEVGGDYYDVLHTDGVVTIGIGDVTGHGLESGILMLMTQTAVRTLQEIKERDPIKFLDTLNRTLYRNVQRMNSEKNLTLAILNYSQGKVSISGQHEETIVVRAGGEIERIDTIDLGLPIAMDDDITEFIDHTMVELNCGDGIVLYTDGIPEAFNIENNQYGMDRLCQVISKNWSLSAEEIKQRVIDDVRNFIGQQKVFDDITLLVFKQN